LRKTGALEVGLVRFAVRWDDGIERMFYIFLHSLAMVYDEGTKRNTTLRGDQLTVRETMRFPAALEGVEAGRVLGPLIVAVMFDALYPSEGARETVAREKYLLSLAFARRPAIPEPERRRLLGRIAQLPEDDEQRVRRLARLLYDKELPSRSAMAGFGRMQNE